MSETLNFILKILYLDKMATIPLNFVTLSSLLCFNVAFKYHQLVSALLIDLSVLLIHTPRNLLIRPAIYIPKICLSMVSIKSLVFGSSIPLDGSLPNSGVVCLSIFAMPSTLVCV